MTADPTTSAVALLAARAGFRADGANRERLASLLPLEAAVHGQSVAAFVASLSDDPDAVQRLLNRVTVQESGFFRHPRQFEALRTHILPGLGGSVTIWSAACANGQEAYSLAMVLDEAGLAGSVFASDISTDALRRAAEGEYTEREIRDVSAARRDRYLVPAGRQFRIRPELRQRVHFFRHNLIEDAIPDVAAVAQVVFCRNVLIYLAPEVSGGFLARLAERVQAGAHVCLGEAETMWQLTDRFAAVRYDAAYFYRRADAPAAVAPRPPAVKRPVVRRHRGAPARREPPPTAAPDPAAAGKAHAAAGDHAAAVEAFRRWAYLARDDPMAHAHLGFALEACGAGDAARRAFRAALGALARSPGDVDLEGFDAATFARMLAAKLKEE